MISFLRWLYNYLTKLMMSCRKHRKEHRLVLSPMSYSSDDDMQYRIPLFEDLNRKEKQ